jgi:hypothetical protein
MGRDKRWLAIYLLVLLIGVIAIVRIQANTRRIDRAQKDVAATVVLACHERVDTLRAIVNLNKSLVVIDGQGDAADARLAVPRLKAIKQLEALIPKCG